MYDVIIVGAGPGGSFTAKLLAEAGYDVILIEKDPISKDKPCAGWVTPQVLDLVKLNPSQLKCCQPIYGAVLWEPKKGQLYPYIVKYDKPVSYGIRRIEFDNILTNQAKDAGAEVVDNTTITTVYRQKKIVFVQAGPNQELKGKFVVGADGTHSVVAKDLWIRRQWNPSELVQCIVCETEIGENIQKLTDYYGFPELFLNVESNSYSWYFTKGSYLNIGVGIQMSRVSQERTVQILYSALLQKLQQINHLNGVNLAPIKSHLYPVYNGPFNYPTYEDRVILIGDAGGFPINFSGEGIRPALLTGKFAAETLIKALEREDTNLNSYHLKWYNELRNEYILGDLLQLLYTPSNHQLYKSLFLEDRRFRRLFFDAFFKRKTPRELLRNFLFYSPFLPLGFLRYGFGRISDYLKSTRS